MKVDSNGKMAQPLALALTSFATKRAQMQMSFAES